MAPAETRIMRKSDWTEGADAPWRSQSKIARLKNRKITVGNLCVQLFYRGGNKKREYILYSLFLLAPRIGLEPTTA